MRLAKKLDWEGFRCQATLYQKYDYGGKADVVGSYVCPGILYEKWLHTANGYQLLPIISLTVNYEFYNALQLAGSAPYLVYVTS
jgi:hypothetical protein